MTIETDLDARPTRDFRDAATQALETSRDRLRDAGDKARELAGTGRERTMDAARVTVAQARRKPVSTGLLVAGAVVGGAMLLNPALRRFAIAAAPTVWKKLRERQGGQRVGA